MSVRIAAAVADAPEETAAALGRYAESIGVAFQIQDDILNVTASALAEGKGFGDDIHEGKITLLVIHALDQSPPDAADRLLAILREHTDDAKRIREAVDILAASGAMDYARQKACELIEQAWREAGAVLPRNDATGALKAFGEFLTSRDI